MIRKLIASVVVLLIGVTFSGGYVLALNLPAAKITIKVVDDDGQPIEGARVGVGFEENTGWGTKEIPVVGFTDPGGHFTASANSNNFIGFNIKKEGYYMSYGSYQFKDKKNGHWQPWNPNIQIILRKIEQPVPMYARNTQKSILEIPVIGKPVGFDLVEYDWVSPHGKGKHADFNFSLNRKFIKEDSFECTLTITFSKKFDGIQVVRENLKYGSIFKLSRFAPKSGYKDRLSRKIKSTHGKPLEYDFDEYNNYIFRVRSEEKEGKFVRAMYGKIQGDIKFDPRGSKTALVGFTYYLNPDYTRNLEFDPRRNLFTDLRSTEKVGLE